MKRLKGFLIYLLLFIFFITGCTDDSQVQTQTEVSTIEATSQVSEVDVGSDEEVSVINCESETFHVSTDYADYDIPDYSGSIYTELNNNVPTISVDDGSNEFEIYSPLDVFDRCGAAYANISINTMPTEERGEIGQVKPSGWHTVKYDCVDGNYLYNRCHLIAFCLAGENANEKNLITGTRQFNVDGMLPFEEKVADFVENSGYHVLYRVTPLYSENNLVAKGVIMEALSVEDNGAGISFNVFVYNVQDGIEIDYADGTSWLEGEDKPTEAEPDPEYESESDYSGENSTVSSEQTENTENMTGESTKQTYIVNKHTGKFHLPECDSVADMDEDNKMEMNDTTADVLKQLGFSPCKKCIGGN